MKKIGLLLLWLLQTVLIGAEFDRWPFPAGDNGKAKLFETASHIGIYNRHSGLLFKKQDFSLIGLYRAEGQNAIVPGTDLWTLEMFFLEPDQSNSFIRYVPFAARQCRQVEVRSEKPDGGIALKARYGNAVYQRMGIDAEVTVTLGDDDELPRWRINAGVANKKLTSIWKVEFPRLNFKNPAARPADCLFALPYRNGILAAFPRQFHYPYPGPAVKFQFLSFYDRSGGEGVYLSTEDSDGYNKEFIVRSDARSNTILTAAAHLPGGRREFGTGFRQSYDVRCGLRKGDWYDDAKRYREWFLTTPYAAAGPMAHRKDVPEWLKQAVMSMKLSCGSKGRTVADNLAGALDAAKFTGRRPILAIWYNFEKKNDICEGMGRVMPPLPGVKEGLEKLKAANVRTLAYVQSLIYDHMNSAEMDAAGPYMAQNILGDYIPYEDGIDVCRNTSWWHNRFLELCRHNIDLGFEGIYLDSFGKGSPDCFAPNHGHKRSGGNAGIAGQRDMAAKVREYLKAESADYTMSGEAPTEAFIDKLDYFLLAVNVLPDSIPLWRAMAGDYMIAHGRGLTFSKAKDNIFGESAELFLEGSILGRISVYGGGIFLEAPGNEKECAFIKKLMNYVHPTLDYLRLGELLRPPVLNPEPPKVAYHEYIGNAEVVRPAVIGSVTRSHRDGSLGYALVNIGSREYNGNVRIDPVLGRGLPDGTPRITVIGEDGRELRKLALEGNHELPVKIAPYEVLFFTVK